MLQRIFTFLFITCCFMQTAFAAPKATFLTLSDIHFDPFLSCLKKAPCPLITKLKKAPASEWPALLAEYDHIKPAYRQDTGYLLLKSTLAAASATAKAENAKFIIITNDFLSHNYRDNYIYFTHDKTAVGYQSFVRKTYIYLASELQAAFPTLSIYPVLGNNDGYWRDYSPVPRHAFFDEFARIWSPLIHDAESRKLFQADFRIAGYYALTLPEQPNLKLISLNTNFFAWQAYDSHVGGATQAEFNWLQQMLKRATANHQRVIIAMHIPEAVDIYLTPTIRLARVLQLWQKKYIVKFDAILKQYAPSVMAILTGHLHADLFHILTFDQGIKVPVNGIPSVSPIFGNDPGFKIMTYLPETGEASDYITYYYPLNGARKWSVKYHST